MRLITKRPSSSDDNVDNNNCLYGSLVATRHNKIQWFANAIIMDFTEKKK